ncbi:hypothetical protein ACFU7Y_40745 [Kitasatospora sp. NPDC057542]|nr:hypothetical protein [Streptomyces sp. LS1784]
MAGDSKETASAKDKTPSGKYAGTEIKIEGEEHLIIREDEVPVATDTE